LWSNHEAEHEIGAEYEQIDTILYCILDKKLSVEEIKKESQIDAQTVEKIYQMYQNSEHKRVNPKPL
jgi:NAD+ synthase